MMYRYCNKRSDPIVQLFQKLLINKVFGKIATSEKSCKNSPTHTVQNFISGRKSMDRILEPYAFQASDNM